MVIISEYTGHEHLVQKETAGRIVNTVWNEYILQRALPRRNDDSGYMYKGDRIPINEYVLESW